MAPYKVLAAVAAIAIEYLLVYSWIRSQRESSLRSMLVKQSPDLVFSSAGHVQGLRSAPFKVVEFGDYQCPPCRLASTQIRELLKESSHDILFEFRNNPLTQIHPHAQKAALVAEAAGEKSRFWEVHDELYADQELLDDDLLGVLCAKYSLSQADLSAASQRVQSDTFAARKLHVSGTPSIFVIDLERNVYLARSVDDVAAIVRNG